MTTITMMTMMMMGMMMAMAMISTMKAQLKFKRVEEERKIAEEKR